MYPPRAMKRGLRAGECGVKILVPEHCRVVDLIDQMRSNIYMMMLYRTTLSGRRR